MLTLRAGGGVIRATVIGTKATGRALIRRRRNGMLVQDMPHLLPAEEKTMEKFILQRGRTALLVIDVQERLAAVLDQEWLRHVVANIQRLLQGMEVLGCPAILTEQYPHGLGATVPELQLFRQKMPVLEKRAFSCCRDVPLVADLQKRDIAHVLLAGMETHVCVLQTALDLLASGGRVHVLEDAVISRTRDNWRAGLALMRDAGAVISTTEIALFQLQETSATESFKRISKLVK